MLVLERTGWSGFHDERRDGQQVEGRTLKRQDRALGGGTLRQRCEGTRLAECRKLLQAVWGLEG